MKTEFQVVSVDMSGYNIDCRFRLRAFFAAFFYLLYKVFLQDRKAIFQLLILL